MPGQPRGAGNLEDAIISSLQVCGLGWRSVPEPRDAVVAVAVARSWSLGHTRYPLMMKCLSGEAVQDKLSLLNGSRGFA